MKIFYLLLLFLLPFVSFGQQLDVSGYFEPQMTVLNVKDTFYNLASNKLRIDLASDLSDHVSFGANFDYITYHGKTEWNILDYLPDTITQGVPTTLQPFFNFTYGDLLQPFGPYYETRPDRIFLDNAFVRLAFKNLDVTVGRQQLSMGTGYTWNPTDLFNTKDVLDPTYEQPGHNAIRVDIPLSSSYGLAAFYAPGEEWKDSVKMLKLKGRLGHFDYSVLGVQRYWSFTDYTSLSENRYSRFLLGGDFAGEFLGLGVWAEGGYSFMDLKEGPGLDPISDFRELVLGLDYTFDSELYFMLEYYHNSLAKRNWKDYTLNDWMWMLSSELKTLGQDQAYGLVQYPMTDLLSIGSMTIFCISDASIALVPMLTYSMFQDVELTVYGNIYVGKEGRHYASNLGSGGLARLRVYF